MKTNKTVKELVWNDLDSKVEQGIAISFLDRASYSVGLAVQYGVNPNTVGRYFRRYIETRLFTSIKNNSPIISR